jgi:hypothetical protein
MDIYLNLRQMLYVGLRDIEENDKSVKQAAMSFTGWIEQCYWITWSSKNYGPMSRPTALAVDKDIVSLLIQWKSLVSGGTGVDKRVIQINIWVSARKIKSVMKESISNLRPIICYYRGQSKLGRPVTYDEKHVLTNLDCCSAKACRKKRRR